MQATTPVLSVNSLIHVKATLLDKFCRQRITAVSSRNVDPSNYSCSEKIPLVSNDWWPVSIMGSTKKFL